MAQAQSQPTQKFINIETVQENTLILKNGALRQILMVSGVNFDLKSEEEQGLLTYAYQNFLNSLNFSVQVFIHSRRLNIEDYLRRIAGIQEQEPNELLKTQLSGYHDFVQSFVSQNPIMSKTFFVVVPFDPVFIPTKGGAGIFNKIFGIFGKKASASANSEMGPQFQQNLQQLTQRVDEVIGGLNSMGLRSVLLANEEIVELFYNLYNPESIEKKRLEIARTEPTR